MHGSIADGLSNSFPTRFAVCVLAVIAACAAFSPTPCVANSAEDRKQSAEDAAKEAAEIEWLSDYSEAMKVARDEGKMLLVYFDSPSDRLSRRFETETLTDAKVREGLEEYVCVRLPLDATIGCKGKEIKLLRHGAFKEMLGRPGIAVVDFASDCDQLNGAVVSTFPLTEALFYTPSRMSVILDLPLASLTQRTMIYAVRIHRERPASTNGDISPYLLEASRRHSDHQARIRQQGHHNWNSRFHRITASLPAGLTAVEVCAESWPGEGMVEAAVECVRCWRFSSGHWRSVRAYHPLYGYDMQRGSNGIWYGTGIFGRR